MAITALRRSRDPEDGAASVEFALVALFALFPLLLGIIQFGFIFYSQITITQAAREGVRPLSLTVPCNSTCQTQAKSRAINAAGPAITLADNATTFPTVKTCAAGSDQSSDAQMVIKYEVTAAFLFRIELTGKASLPCGG